MERIPGMTPNEVLDMTFPQIMLTLKSFESIEVDERNYRYSRMSPEVRDMADKVKRKFGSY